MTTLLDASAPDVSVDVTFADLGLPPEMVDQLDRSGMSTPFAIQAAVIPDTLDGRDIAGREPKVLQVFARGTKPSHRDPRT